MLTNIITVSMPFTIAIIIICFNFNINIVQTLLIVLISIILNIVVSHLGILINLVFPKLNFESEIQVVKQSTSTFYIGVFYDDIFCDCNNS